MDVLTDTEMPDRGPDSTPKDPMTCGVYGCPHDIWGTHGIGGTYTCTGVWEAYGCMGGIQTYGGIWTYRGIRMPPMLTLPHMPASN